MYKVISSPWHTLKEFFLFFMWVTCLLEVICGYISMYTLSLLLHSIGSRVKSTTVRTRGKARGRCSGNDGEGARGKY